MKLNWRVIKLTKTTHTLNVICIDKSKHKFSLIDIESDYLLLGNDNGILKINRWDIHWSKNREIHLKGNLDYDKKARMYKFILNYDSKKISKQLVFLMGGRD
jgi:hypothetical protein